MNDTAMNGVSVDMPKTPKASYSGPSLGYATMNDRVPDARWWPRVAAFLLRRPRPTVTVVRRFKITVTATTLTVEPVDTARQ